MKPLILVGGGGHCKSVIEVAETAGYRILGVLDTPDKLGTKVLSYSVIGCDDDIPMYAESAQFVITVGQIQDTKLRENIAQRIEDAGGELATIIAKSAVVSKYSKIGKGSVIMHNCVVNADAQIGKHVIVNTFANIEHDAIVGDFCHISTGTMINGNCVIGNNVFIGSQSVVSNGVKVLDNCLIGAGSFVRKNTRYPGVYSGNPAIIKKKYHGK
ncbi:MAG: acetyltransferase [Pleomorphochaeta sp.]